MGDRGPESQFNPEEKLSTLKSEQKKEVDFIPKVNDIPSVYLELWKKHGQYPVDNEVWDQVIDMAKKEENTEIGKRGIYGKILLDSLLDLSEKVRLESDNLKRYKLLTKKSPNEKIWFEVLSGLHKVDIESDYLIKKIGERHWENALDLGTGTGDIIRKIEPYCNHLTGVDQIPSLIQIAREQKVGKEKFKIGNVLKLPFRDNNFDLAVSAGLVWSLNRNQLEKYVSELTRVLKPSGSYFQSALLRPNEDLDIFELKSLANAKGILADLIVDKASGRADKKELISYKDLGEVFRNKGFTIKNFENQDGTAKVFEFVNHKR